jgi:hypothetical protein
VDMDRPRLADPMTAADEERLASSRSKALSVDRRGNGACQTCSNASVPRTKEQSEVVVGRRRRTTAFPCER